MRITEKEGKLIICLESRIDTNNAAQTEKEIFGAIESGKEFSFDAENLEYIDTDLYERLKKLFDEIPEQHNIIHGDAQMKNVMLKDGEPMLVDMDTLAEGHTVFDIQSIYVAYYAFSEDEPGNSMVFFGIPTETTNKIWQDFIKYYFDTEDESRISQLRDKITIVGCIRFLSLIDQIMDHSTELFRLRVKHTVERLSGLAYSTETLLFD